MTATGSAISARPKTALVSLLVVAFLCGAAAGAVSMRAYTMRIAETLGGGTERPKMTLERWRRDLNLTDDQSAQILMILDDFDKYYDNVVAEGHERIIQVLRPEQRVQFEKMLKKRD